MNAPRNPVGWFEIYVQDMARARAFYEATLQVTLEVLMTPDSLQAGGMEMWMFPGQPERSGCPGALVRYPGKDSGAGGTLIYFSCEDCAVEAARALQHGGQIQREKMAIGAYGFIVLLLDPEGNMIGLHSLQ